MCGREPEGIVETVDVALQTELIDAMRQLKDPKDDTPMILNVYDGATIFQGAYADEAPDLVVGYAPGYRASWQTSLGATPVVLVEDNRERWIGDHCIDPPQVPGVLFTSFALKQPIAAIGDLAKLIVGTSSSGTEPQP
ncbi:MAG: hypothetical protein ABI451_11725 [Dokdonella sp.]